MSKVKDLSNLYKSLSNFNSSKKSYVFFYYGAKISEPAKTKLLENFKTEKWANLNDEKKLNVFQQLENIYAKEQNREPAKIVIETDPSNYGSYSPETNQININLNTGEKNNSYDQLDSYFHESRHAYQSSTIKKGKGLDQTTLSMCEVEDTSGNYISGGILYDLQTCEMDSNNTAVKKMLERKEMFKDDPYFQNYLERREQHFNEVNETLETYKNERKAHQIKCIDRSYNFNDISINQKNQLTKYINSNKEELGVVESKNISKILQYENSLTKNNKNNYQSENAFIEKGNLSEQDVALYTDNKNIKSINAYDSNAKFNKEIKHPEYGDSLVPVKEYYNTDNGERLYAEYKNNKNESYHYVDKRNDVLVREHERVDIESQQISDQKKLENYQTNDNMNEQNHSNTNEQRM